MRCLLGLTMSSEECVTRLAGRFLPIFRGTGAAIVFRIQEREGLNSVRVGATPFCPIGSIG